MPVNVNLEDIADIIILPLQTKKTAVFSGPVELRINVRNCVFCLGCFMNSNQVGNTKALTVSLEDPNEVVIKKVLL